MRETLEEVIEKAWNDYRSDPAASDASLGGYIATAVRAWMVEQGYVKMEVCPDCGSHSYGMAGHYVGCKRP